MSAQTRIRDLVLAKLGGRKIDVVSFMDELLEFVKEVGEIRCCLAGEGRLRFETPDRQACEVELDGCRGKLRMLCARLSVLCNEADGAAVSPYGGSGVIEKASPDVLSRSSTENGHALGASCRWTAQFKNTPAEQEFTIIPVKVENADTATPRS